MWLFCSTFLYWFREKIFRWYIKLKYTALRVIVLVFVIIILLWLSIFLYGSFYFTYMPSVVHMKPVHLQFSRSCKHKGLCNMEDMVYYPTANISLLKEDGEGILMYGQSYKIYLDLEMPESPVNQKLGMFMVKMNVMLHNEVLKSSARSAMLHYKSFFLQLIQAAVIAPLVIFGTAEEKQLLHINLFDNYIEDPYKQSRLATIEIQAVEIEIYSAVLRIHAHFTGLRYLMFNHPLVSFVLGVGTNMIFLTAVALLSWYHCVWGREHEEFLIRTISTSSSGVANTSLLERQQAARQMLHEERKGQGVFESIQEDEVDTSESGQSDESKSSFFHSIIKRSDLEQVSSTPKDDSSVVDLEPETVLAAEEQLSEGADDLDESQESFDNVQEIEIPSPEQMKSDIRYRHNVS